MRHHSQCSCMRGFSRRGLFGLAVGAAATSAVRPALAIDQGYEAMLVKCIDPRFTTNTWAYMAGRGWQNPVQPVQHCRRPDRRRSASSSRTGTRRSGTISISR